MFGIDKFIKVNDVFERIIFGMWNIILVISSGIKIGK